MQIKDVYRREVNRFREATIADPELEVSLLLAHALNLDRTSLLLEGDRDLDDRQLLAIAGYTSRRLKREPLAYITGEKEFWSLPFKVSKDVLIPRPETEILVELALRSLKGRESEPVRILDLGTGSGIMAIVLALELPASTVTGVDLSRRALKVARHNAMKHEVTERVHFINSDWFGGLSTEQKFDLVVANPPYIAREIVEEPCGSSEILEPEVVEYEPHMALDGGEKGIEAIHVIADNLGEMLVPGGLFFMEIGYDQAVEVKGIFHETGSFDKMLIHKDYAGLPRVFQARKKSE